MKPFMLLLCVLPLASVPADEVRLEWMSEGFYDKTHYQVPKFAPSLQEKPSQIVKVPEGLVNPRYSMLATGLKSQRSYMGIILDERSPKDIRLWLDANGDGDLTNDPEVKWQFHAHTEGDREIISWHGTAKVQLKYPDATHEMGLVFYSNGRFKGQTPLMYHRDYGRTGKIQLNGREMAVYLSDDSTTGEFTTEHTSLCIDVNANRRIDLRKEEFHLNKPFVIEEAVYEVKNLAPDGSRFDLVRSDKPLAQMREEKQTQESIDLSELRPLPKNSGPQIGQPAPSFEARTLDGKTVRFPEDFKGRLVMLDFWATWCGPCVHELPGLAKVYEEFASHGFSVLGVSLDHDDDVGELPMFLKSNRMSWPQVCDGTGWQGEITKLYGVRGIPSCWLIDGDTGRIVASGFDLRGGALRGTVEKALGSLGTAAGKPSAVASIPPSAEKAERAVLASNSLFERLQKLAARSDLMTPSGLRSQLDHPSHEKIKLATPLNTPLRGREIARRAAEAHVRVGWIYQCDKCSLWHSSLNGGFAIASDVVVTARHVMTPPPNMRADHGHPVIVRGEEEIIGIKNVLFADERADTVILRVTAKDLTPLALTRDVQVGDHAYCFSDPRDVLGHFSAGMVNRMHAASKSDDPNNPLEQRMDVSADWAHGSSGSAILDEYGNAIGHVARIRPLLGASQGSEPAASKAAIPTLMTLNEAIPASVVLSVIEKDSAP